ncbi:MAG: glycosyltransferase family 2 protein, partial [Actinomycetota bacterium]|nr:glycosyltransferase family 2 protein [Actinomycetota bacterium]
RKNLAIEEVPVTLSPRIGGEPKLNTWHDGWRHLRFMLLEAPGWVLLLPGIVLTLMGAVIVATLSFGPVYVGSVLFDVNALVFGALMMVLGVQTVLLGLTTKIYARSRHFDEGRGFIRAFDRWFTLERGLLVGGAVLGFGFVPAVYLTVQRASGSPFGDANLRLSVLALVLIVVGAQIVFQSFFASMLRVRELAPNTT